MDETTEQETTFTCDHCGWTFLQGWSDEEAQAEARENWGGDLPDEERAILCNGCYREFIGWMQDG